MKCRRIRLTEDELYGLISETITETINESGFLQRVASYFNSNNNNQTQKKTNNPTEPNIPYKYRHNVNQVGFGRNPDIMKFNYDAQDEKDYLDRVRQWKYRKYLKPLYTSNAQYSGTTTP